MASLGAPVTGQNIIGTFEVRIGPQSSAGRLLQSHSIGVIDNFTLDLRQDTVDLMAGFPQEPVDTAIVSQISGLSFTLREYSVRNMNMMLGNGVASSATATYQGTVDTTSNIAKGTSAVTLNDLAGEVAAGDTVVFYHATDRSKVFVVYVESATVGASTTDIVFSPPLPELIQAGTVFYAYKAEALAFGQQSTVQYFSCSLVQLDRANGKPLVFDFWKAALESGPQISTGGTEFASTETRLKFLEPTASEHLTTYSNVYSEFTAYPVGRYVMAQDVQ